MELTKKELDVVGNNLRAFIHNFGEPRITRDEYGKGFYVFIPENTAQWIQHCYDINYLNGWLYGVVQGALRIEFKEAMEHTLEEQSKTEHKMHDEWDIEGFYDGEWSVECTELTEIEARLRLREYQENCPKTAFRIVKHRISNEVGA